MPARNNHCSGVRCVTSVSCRVNRRRQAPNGNNRPETHRGPNPIPSHVTRFATGESNVLFPPFPDPSSWSRLLTLGEAARQGRHAREERVLS